MYKAAKDKPKEPKLKVKIKASGHAAGRLLKKLGYNPQNG